MNETSIRALIGRLRDRMHEYRLYADTVSIHLNAIEMAIILIEYGLDQGTRRAVRPDEEQWFSAGRSLDELYRNSKWHDLVDGYYQLADFAKANQFFRHSKTAI